MRSKDSEVIDTLSIPTIAVGASAGGLDAFKKFLSHLPNNSGMSFVFIQHLDPNHKTMMPELLQSSTKMKILEVQSKIEIEKDHIYFIAPNSILTIRGNYLIPEVPKQPHGHRSPIDIFFTSLAKEKKGESVGVILSGTGSDGSIGVKAIKEVGGLTFAQSLDSATYDSMPRSAIGTGMIDFILNIESMSEHLVQYITQKIESKFDVGLTTKEAKKILPKVCKYLLHHLHHDFSKYKENTLIRRIHRRMQLRQLEDGSEYFKIVKTDIEEAKALLNDFLIGVTYFFRDADVFDYLKSDVLPEILKVNKDLVRVWVPGCATGEEAYTIAILLSEVMEELDVAPRVQIFATDLDERSIATGRAGVYTEGIVEHVNPDRIKKYFNKMGNCYEVTKNIRDMCLFSKHNLLQDPPFAKIDLVSCRNLLIYFGIELQKNVFGLFTYSVKNNGYLLLGPTESIRGDESQFEVVHKEFKIFKNLNSYYLPKVSFPLRSTGIPKLDTITDSAQVLNRTRQYIGFSQKIDNLMLKKHIPPHVIVNKDFEVQYYSHNLSGLIVPTKGVPSNNLIQLIAPDLRVELRSLLAKCVRKSMRTSNERIPFSDGDNSFSLNIEVEPIDEDEEELEKLILVVFHKTKIENNDIEIESIFPENDDAPEELTLLHSEIKKMKLQLKSTVEELEHANEELKSSNEELLSLNEEMQSGNEELQTSHEEMQSVNEELETVNVELSTKVSQLDAANSDLENLFRSTEIATVFLDNNLRIKRFTPKAKELFHFIESDLQRPITDLALSFENYNIESELLEVMKLLTSNIQTVKLSKSDTWFKIQMHPYKTINNIIDGAIITLHDVTELKQIENELSYRLSQQVSVAEFGFKALSNDMELSKLKKLAVKVLKNNFKTEYSKFLEIQESGEGLLLAEGIGWNKGLVGNHVLGLAHESQAGYTLHSKRAVLIEDSFLEKRFNVNTLLLDHHVRSSISVAIKGPSGKAYGVLGVDSKVPNYFSEKDIQYVQSIANTLATATERHNLIATKTRLAQIVNSSKNIIFSCDRDEKINSWNPAAEKIYDIKSEDVLGESVSQFILRESDSTELEREIQIILQGESSLEEINCEFFNSTGNKVVLSLNLTPILGNLGKVEGVSFVGRDISDQINNQQLLIDAKNSADEANELKSRFMGVLSHELRTPLSSILGYADLLLKSQDISDRDRNDYLLKISKNGNLLHSLVSDILDVSKIEEGKVDIKKTFFKLKDYMTELTSTLGVLANKKNLKLDVNYIGQVPEKIKTDPLRLRQILENLVSNAIKYTSSGCIEIRLSVIPQDNSSYALEVEVEDTGRGIPKSKAISLFSPFFRAEPGKGAPGVGLGLYLAKNLAKQLGGRLSLLESTVNKGSIFKLFIPVQILKKITETMQSHQSDSPIITNTSLKNKKIILAEDSEDLRILLTAYIELAGAKVDAFENGQLALDSLKHNKYDLAVLDLFMPVMDGKELVAEIKKNSIDVPAIVVTAHAMSNVRQECLDLGFKDYISKPVTQNNLIKTILKNLDA